jgi:hypothetical protein
MFYTLQEVFGCRQMLKSSDFIIKIFSEVVCLYDTFIEIQYTHKIPLKRKLVPTLGSGNDSVVLE